MGGLRPKRTDMRGGSALTKRARGLRGNMTDAEQLLWRDLRRNQLGWRFRRQFPIPPYIADFACVEARLIVESDGGQYALPGDHDLRDQQLRRLGWRVLRFWNNDIRDNLAGVLRTIAEALGTPRPQDPHPTLPRLRGEGAVHSATVSSPPPQAGEG